MLISHKGGPILSGVSGICERWQQQQQTSQAISTCKHANLSSAVTDASTLKFARALIHLQMISSRQASMKYQNISRISLAATNGHCELRFSSIAHD
jgi:hypothetical protein